MRGIGSLFGLVSVALIGRLLGGELLGTYFLATAIAGIFAVLSRLGLELPVMRQIALASDAQDGSLSRAIMRRAVLLIAPAGVLLTVIMFFSAPFIAEMFGLDAGASMLRIVSLGILPLALMVVVARGLMSLQRPIIAEFLQRAGAQIVFICLVLGFYRSLGGVAAGLAYSVSLWLMLLVGIGAFVTLTSAQGGRAEISSLTLLRPGFQLLIASSLGLVIAWSDTLLIGYFMEPVDVAAYGVALRIVSVLSFVLVATSTTAGPRFASLYAQGSRDQLARFLRQSARLSGAAALAIAVFLILFSRPLVGVFGIDNQQAVLALIILAVAGIVTSGVGLVGMALTMTGNERRIRQTSFFAAGLNIVLNLALIPIFGIVGAAVATASAVILTNVLNLRFVRRDLNISVITGRCLEESPNN